VGACVGFAAEMGLGEEGSASVGEGEAAGLEEGYVDSLHRQTMRQGQASDSGSDDADLGAEGVGARGVLDEVNLHGVLRGIVEGWDGSRCDG